MRTRSPNAGQTALTLQHATSPRAGYKPPPGHNTDGYTMAEKVSNYAKGGRAEKPIRKTTTGKGANYRKTKSGAGMTAKGVKAYRAANPGSKLKTAVTGKVKKGSKAANRRKSYCARSAGQLKNSSAKTRNDPNSRIRQARRRWKC
jgi:hypothetical protein